MLLYNYELETYKELNWLIFHQIINTSRLNNSFSNIIISNKLFGIGVISVRTI